MTLTVCPLQWDEDCGRFSIDSDVCLVCCRYCDDAYPDGAMNCARCLECFLCPQCRMYIASGEPRCMFYLFQEDIHRIRFCVLADHFNW